MAAKRIVADVENEPVEAVKSYVEQFDELPHSDLVVSPLALTAVQRARVIAFMSRAFPNGHNEDAEITVGDMKEDMLDVLIDFFEWMQKHIAHRPQALDNVFRDDFEGLLNYSMTYMAAVGELFGSGN